MRASLRPLDPSPRALDRSRRSYNLFNLKEKPHLYCAVPQDHPVPRFITFPYWEFRGTIDHSALGPFRSRAALLGVRLNGFFLFFSLEDHIRTGAFRKGHEPQPSNAFQPAA